MTSAEFSGKDAINQVLDWQVLTEAAGAVALARRLPPHGIPARVTPDWRRPQPKPAGCCRRVASKARGEGEADERPAPRWRACSRGARRRGSGRPYHLCPADCGQAPHRHPRRLPCLRGGPLGQRERSRVLPARRGRRPGSFAVEARSYEVLGEALERKLLLEFIAAPLHDAQAVVAKLADAGG